MRHLIVVVVAAIAFSAGQLSTPEKAQAAPMMVTPPNITGTLEVGRTINLSAGTWTTTWSSIAFYPILWSCTTTSPSSCSTQHFVCAGGWNLCQNSTFDLTDSFDGRFLRLEVDVGDNTGFVETFSTIVGPVTQSRSLLVRTVGTGAVTASGATIGCPSVCTATVPNGTLVTLTASPASGWAVSSWGGSCSGSQATCSILMNQSREVSVTFVEVPTSSGGSGLTSNPIDVPTPTGVRWSVQDLYLTAEFANSTSAAYAISATSGSTSVSGSCSTTNLWTTCRVRVTPGTWVGSITPQGDSTSSLTTRRLAADTVERITSPVWSQADTTTPLTTRFKAAEKTTYMISAQEKGKTKTLRGSCRITAGMVTCTIPLKTTGRWIVSVIPKVKTSLGKPAKKTILVRAARSRI